jgi:hypothetical protein
VRYSRLLADVSSFKKLAIPQVSGLVSRRFQDLETTSSKALKNSLESAIRASIIELGIVDHGVQSPSVQLTPQLRRGS